MEVVGFMKPTDYDRIDVNKSDGQKFYGYDNEDGTTDWYTEDDMLDSRTKTPSDDEDDW
ncbi:TPA: hypothetical protein ACXNXA_000236 [Clostridium botulinum]